MITSSNDAWTAARAMLDGLPNGGLNIAHEAVGRHARGERAEQLAIRWLGKDGSTRQYTYRELYEQVGRFANLLAALGVRRGETVFSLLPRVPELYFTALGTLAHGAVFCPLFSAFGPEPIWTRLSQGRAKLLVTTTKLYARKLAELRARLPDLEHVLLIDDVPSLVDVMAEQASEFQIAPTGPEDPALLHFTSGTTGRPKGALHVHEAVVAHHVTGQLALDLRPGTRFWCTADPGWVTGTSYGIIAPLSNAATLLVDESELEAVRWYRILQSERVEVWYTAPTALRMLMRAGAQLARSYDLSNVRFIASVGEPLNPEAVRWGIEAFGQPIRDNWWQTETGGIMIANLPGMPVEPGSMGRPLPGVEAGIVERDDDGHVRELEHDREGELALRPGWPSMFRAYLDDPERYAKCFADGWYLTGDLARRDDAGYYWFVGRADDVIKSSGHLIGPFEVESALLEHPSVAEAGVIGKPDPIAGAIVKAFVALRPGFEPSDALARELIGFTRTRLGPAVAPRELAFLPDIPKTRSGKIMRRLLKARELGLPEGDLSTLLPTTDAAEPSP